MEHCIYKNSTIVGKGVHVFPMTKKHNTACTSPFVFGPGCFKAFFQFPPVTDDALGSLGGIKMSGGGWEGGKKVQGVTKEGRAPYQAPPRTAGLYASTCEERW